MSVFVSFMVKVYAETRQVHTSLFCRVPVVFLDETFMPGTSGDKLFLCYTKGNKYVLHVQ